MDEVAEAAESAIGPPPGAEARPGGAGEIATAEARANRRKVREGTVVSAKMDKTAVVAVVDRVRHPKYGKTVQRTKRLYVDVPGNDLREGDRVRVAETKPSSKLKRWRLVEILERAR